jgi:hypothetical protein
MNSEEIQSLCESAQILDGLSIALPEINSQIQGINDGLRETMELLIPLWTILADVLETANAVGTRLKSE